MEINTRKWSAMILAAMVLISSTAQAQTTDFSTTYPAKVPFLQAAVFFMTGEEPPNVKLLSEKRAIVKTATYVKLPNGSARGVTSYYEYLIAEDNPCTIRGYLHDPIEISKLTSLIGESVGARRLEFNKLPSPGSIVEKEHYYSLSLPHETWCSAKTAVVDGKVEILKGSSTCNQDMGFERNAQTHRRMAALDYIRANFCKGQPEPPPKPRMPY
jgi:hypothetical protein